MSADEKTYREASDVSGNDGEVHVHGPDSVEVKLTPEAAAETSDRLLTGALKAEGQRHLKDLPHKEQ
ncbi:MAG: hypothetical protein ACJ8EY_10505 [Sphingomicrobium sp.]